MIVTIDGPAGSGKSTVARAVAQQLDYYYIASGSLYRSLSYVLMQYYGYSLKDINNPSKKDVESALDSNKFRYMYNNITGEKILFETIDLSLFLKSELVTSAASLMATSSIVNEQLVKFQRALAQDRDIIIDGRNCGSEVFPQAEVKLYMTASVQIRATRWQQVQQKQGIIISLEQAEHLVTDRDKRDEQRKVAPLKVPTNAIIIDTSAMDINQAVKKTVAEIDRYYQKA